MPIPLDKLTIHNDDMRLIGWFDTPQKYTDDLPNMPSRGTVSVNVIDNDAVEQRENALTVERIARQRDYEARTN